MYIDKISYFWGTSYTSKTLDFETSKLKTMHFSLLHLQAHTISQPYIQKLV